MKKFLIILVSIIIDGLIPNITLYSFNNITYFTPMCTIISLIFFFEKNEKFYHLLFWIIIIYSSLYINNLILSAVLFISITLIINSFKRFFKHNLFTVIIQILLVISIWDLIYFIVFSLMLFESFIWSNYLYKVIHSFIFNIIYGIILFLIYNRKSSKSYS